MINIYHFMLAALIAYVLLKHIFLKLIYFMCEVILGLNGIIDYSERKKEDWANSLIIRLFYLCVFLIAWGLMLLLFVPMQMLTYLEVFGGFVDESIFNTEEEH